MLQQLWRSAATALQEAQQLVKLMFRSTPLNDYRCSHPSTTLLSLQHHHPGMGFMAL
jgi:hypothetical protein